MATVGGPNMSWVTAVSVWLFLAMTSALVTAKVSLLWLLRLYKYEQIHPATWYFIVTVLLVSPLLCHVTHLVWNTPFIHRGHSRLPRASMVCLGVLSSVGEGAAMAVFGAELSPLLPEPVLLLLPSSVFAMHLLVDSQRSVTTKWDRLHEKPVAKETRGRGLGAGFVRAVGGSFLLWAGPAVGVLLHVWSPFALSLPALLALPPALLVLSAAWTQHLQVKVVSPRDKAGGQGGSAPCLRLAYALVRTASLLATLYLVITVKIDAFTRDATAFLHHVGPDVSDGRVWGPLAVCCGAGLGSVVLGGVASKVCVPTPGLVLPALLTPPLSLGAALVLWRDLDTGAFWELSGSDAVSWAAVGVATAAWLLPFLLPGESLARWPRLPLRPFSAACHALSWRPFFLEQHLLLNTRDDDVDVSGDPPPGVVTSLSHVTSEGRRRAVYICTTMYRETRAEMRRYLDSLQRVFADRQLPGVDLEAHIFLDSCIQPDLTAGPYVRQLLSLIVTTLHVQPSDMQRYATPYGCQVTCRVRGGHVLVVHCKDGSKVKGQKRWSQVMYMHYVLRHKAGDRFPAPATAETGGDAGQPRLNNDARAKNQDTVWHLSHSGTPPSQSQISRTLSNVLSPRTEGVAAVSEVDSGTRPESVSSHRSSCNRCGQRSLGLNSSPCDNPTCPSSTVTSSGSTLNRMSGDLQTKQTSRPTSKCPGYGVVSGDDGGKRSGSKDHQTPLCDVDKAGYGLKGQGHCGVTPDWSLHNSTTPLPTKDCSTIRNALSDVTSDDVYILATDADTEFNGESVGRLLSECRADPRLGAVCGRTWPKGARRPVVWYQQFEYAKDFWLVKSSQNVIGSVTCCPGCFSLYRAGALSDVIAPFARPSLSAFDTLVQDHGEDRWLCTLLMQGGWGLRYADNCHNSTHCPETWGEFLRQRRRWVLSELTNTLLIFTGLRGLVRGHSAFSAVFVLSLVQLFLWALLSPSTALLLLCAALHVLFALPLPLTAPLALGLLAALAAVCVTQPRHTQRLMTQAVVVVIVSVTIAVSAGFVDYVIENVKTDVAAGHVGFRPYLLVLGLVGAVLYAGMLNPREAWLLPRGVVYCLISPALHVVLPVYALANIVDTSWGTRDASGSRACCDVILDDDDDSTDDGRWGFSTSSLPSLSTGDSRQRAEHSFWLHLRHSLLGPDVTAGPTPGQLTQGLTSLRARCVAGLLALNLLWFGVLTSIYLYVSDDVAIVAVASVFSFSLAVQLVGMTSYRLDQLLRGYVTRQLQHEQL